MNHTSASIFNWNSRPLFRRRHVELLDSGQKMHRLSWGVTHKRHVYPSVGHLSAFGLNAHTTMWPLSARFGGPFWYAHKARSTHKTPLLFIRHTSIYLFMTFVIQPLFSDPFSLWERFFRINQRAIMGMVITFQIKEMIMRCVC